MGYLQSPGFHLGRMVSDTVRRLYYPNVNAAESFVFDSFFSTTYVAEIYQNVHDFETPKATTATSPHEADPATRAGSRAMFLQAVISFACSVILPFLTAPLVPAGVSVSGGLGHRKARSSVDEDIGFRRNTRMAWSESILDKILNSRFIPTLPLAWLDLTLLWMIAHLFFAFLMFSTFFVSRVWSATLIIALLGFSCKLL